jgi:hypothetical protein
MYTSPDIQRMIYKNKQWFEAMSLVRSILDIADHVQADTPSGADVLRKLASGLLELANKP